VDKRGSFSFLAEYLKRPKAVGAVLPSSKFLAQKMVAGIDFENAKCIVEYGPGTGVFTELLLQRRKPDTMVIVFEMNDEFCQILNVRFGGEKNFKIISDSAETIGAELANITNGQPADCIISGLPFASLPDNVSHSILEETKKYLRPGGLFITFQYTLLKKALLSKYFNEIEIEREVRNLPPAYVVRCRDTAPASAESL